MRKVRERAATLSGSGEKQGVRLLGTVPRAEAHDPFGYLAAHPDAQGPAVRS